MMSLDSSQSTSTFSDFDISIVYNTGDENEVWFQH